MFLTACEKQDANRPPETAPSTDQVTYAEEYPEQMSRVSGQLDEGQAKVTESSSKFTSYPPQIKDPSDRNIVAEVYRAADESGRSQAYVERARENEKMVEIMEENNGEIGKKVAGAVQYSAQQGGCSADLGSAAAGALKRTLDKRLEDRLKERNRAYEVIDRNEEALGKNNVETLKKQSDEIAQASYVANIKLPTKRAELNRLISERDQVASTIDRNIEEEKKLQAQEGISDSAKKASEKRVTELEKAKQALSEVQQYDAEQLKQLDDKVKQTKEAYKTAFDQLLKDTEGKSSSDSPPSGAAVEASVK